MLDRMITDQFKMFVQVADVRISHKNATLARPSFRAMSYPVLTESWLQEVVVLLFF
jgi:hypothetical protein